MTFGSTAQKVRVWWPGPASTCVVVVRLMLSEVLRSHCLFIEVLFWPVAAMMSTICGVPPSTETAYRSL